MFLITGKEKRTLALCKMSSILHYACHVSLGCRSNKGNKVDEMPNTGVPESGREVFEHHYRKFYRANEISELYRYSYMSKPKHVCIACRYYLFLLTDMKPRKFLSSEGVDAHFLLHP